MNIIQWIFVGMIIVFLLGVFTGAFASERDYAGAFCESVNGARAEIRENGKRVAEVDCLTDTLAIEVDWGNHWYECLSQALWYSVLTGRNPACALIVGPQDQRFVDRLKRTVEGKCLGITILQIPTATQSTPAGASLD